MIDIEVASPSNVEVSFESEIDGTIYKIEVLDNYYENGQHWVSDHKLATVIAYYMYASLGVSICMCAFPFQQYRLYDALSVTN